MNYLPLTRSTFLYYLPRYLGVLVILFISSFALDVFVGGESLFHSTGALIIHLLPSILLSAILGIAWKFERVGGILFIGTALLPFLLLDNPFWINTLLSVPFLVTGVLFLLSAQRDTRLTKKYHD